MSTGTPAWRDRLRPLSALSLLLAAWLAVSSVVVPHSMASLNRFQERHGESPGALSMFATSPAWPALTLMLAARIIAKDWWLRTTRARVWVNLALGVALALACGFVMWTVMKQYGEQLKGFGG